jgi:hypothetical protein
MDIKFSSPEKQKACPGYIFKTELLSTHQENANKNEQCVQAFFERKNILAQENSN